MSRRTRAHNSAGTMKASFLPSRAAKGYNLINKFIKLHLEADGAACPAAAEAHPELGTVRDLFAPA